MKYQPAATPATEGLRAELEALLSLAVRVLNAHTDAADQGAVCGSAWPYELVLRADHKLRPGGGVSCRLSWVGPATRPGGAAGPTHARCAGPRLRPMVVGYVRLQASDPPGLADLLITEMRAFAHRCGLALADTYTEQPDVSSREGAALSALVEALRRPHIMIPSAGHFSRFGGMYQAMRTLIETETGTDVLVMSDRAEGAR